MIVLRCGSLTFSHWHNDLDVEWLGFYFLQLIHIHTPFNPSFFEHTTFLFLMVRFPYNPLLIIEEIIAHAATDKNSSAGDQ